MLYELPLLLNVSGALFRDDMRHDLFQSTTPVFASTSDKTTRNLEYGIVSTGFCFSLQSGHWTNLMTQAEDFRIPENFSLEASIGFAHPYRRILAWYPEPREGFMNNGVETSSQV
jgi:hypothetical protein